MCIEHCKIMVSVVLMCIGGVVLTPRASASNAADALNEQLSAVLSYHGFTGRVGGNGSGG